jgi:hypothetical protein
MYGFHVKACACHNTRGMSRQGVDPQGVQIPMPDDMRQVTTKTQVSAIIEKYGLSDAVNPDGIAFSLFQLWYYHYPIAQVRTAVRTDMAGPHVCAAVIQAFQGYSVFAF